MSDSVPRFLDPDHVKRYREQGPPAFAPGHAGMLQMTAVLLAERVPRNGHVLVVGAGGGLETEYLASVQPEWRFTGVDPVPEMIEMARATAGEVAKDRLALIEGTVEDAPPGPFDGATCILVMALVPDDGSKLNLLVMTRKRMKTGAPIIVVDQGMDREAPDFERNLDRYSSFARLSGVSAETVSGARAALSTLKSMVPPWRTEQLLDEAGFKDIDVFYVAMAWRGWVAYA